MSTCSSTDVGALPRLDHLLELLDQVDEALDLVQRPAGQPGCVLGALQRLPEGDPVAGGQRLDAGLGTLADAALGGVQHPPQRHRVGRVDQHPQVGERVADFATLVEAHAADHAVGHPDRMKHFLEDAGLGVGPVEDGDVAGPRLPSSVRRVDLLGHEPGLVALVVADVPDDPLPAPASVHRLFGLRPSLRLDHARWRRSGSSASSGSSARA